MSKPDNVRGLGSDYSLVMVKSTSWPKSKVNKESTEKIRERGQRGALTTGALNGGNKNLSFTPFLRSISIIENF